MFVDTCSVGAHVLVCELLGNVDLMHFQVSLFRLNQIKLNSVDYPGGSCDIGIHLRVYVLCIHME